MELSRGAVIAGKYRLERPLGEGGMGVVWAATHTVTGKSCALKFLKDSGEGTPGASSARERFLREARAACAIQHPNVAPVHDVLEDDGQPLLVMDLLEGEPLSRLLQRRGALSLAETARLLLPVIDAVCAIHKSGIVHRDLKPDNVFLVRRADGATDVKVLDFGIAKMSSVDPAGTPALTATGAMIGTPFYMAPEQIFGDKDIDARADVWALGVILYECLAGARPTAGEGVGQVIKIITTDSIKPLEDVVETPPELARLAREMLSRDREERPALEEVRGALARYAPHSTAPPPAPDLIIAGDASPHEPTHVESAPVSMREPSPESERWPETSRGSASRSKKLLWAAIMVGASGLGAVALVGQLRRSSSVASVEPPAALGSSPSLVSTAEKGEPLVSRAAASESTDTGRRTPVASPTALASHGPDAGAVAASASAREEKRAPVVATGKRASPEDVKLGPQRVKK